MKSWLLLSLFFVASVSSVEAAIKNKNLGCESIFETRSRARALAERYDVKAEDIDEKGKYPVVIRGLKKNGIPKVELLKGPPVRESKVFDSVVVGGGPSGLTSSLYLAESGKNVLVVEANPELGGLAAGGTHQGVQHARGAAYYTPVGAEVFKIFQHIGLQNYKGNEIHFPTDSFYWNGKYYEGLWESPKALEELPASFSVFKRMLDYASAHEGVPDTPMEKAPSTFELDKMNAAQWVRNMPQELENLAARSPRDRALLERFLNDPKVNRADPMGDVIGLLDLYGRSAFGDHIERISAAAFADFYESELYERFTGTGGTGIITEKLKAKLDKQGNRVEYRLGARVQKIRHLPDGEHVEVEYVQDGQVKIVVARSAVFAAPLGFAPKLIEGYENLNPEHKALTENLDYRDYMVINVHVKGHPWTKTYDLWVRDDKTYSQEVLSDIIDGRYREFQDEHGPIARNDDRGVISIYHPLPGSSRGRKIDEDEVKRIVESSVDHMKEVLGGMINKDDIDVQLVEANYWPYSIHVAPPGHFSNSVKLNEPVGRIFMSNNNIGVPGIEEALYRAKKAALDIIARLKAEEDAAQTRRRASGE